MPKKLPPAAGAAAARAAKFTSVLTALLAGQRTGTLPRSRISRPSETKRFVTYMRRAVRVDGLPANETTSPTSSRSRGRPDAVEPRQVGALDFPELLVAVDGFRADLEADVRVAPDDADDLAARLRRSCAASYSAVEWCAESGEPSRLAASRSTGRRAAERASCAFPRTRRCRDSTLTRAHAFEATAACASSVHGTARLPVYSAAGRRANGAATTPEGEHAMCDQDHFQEDLKKYSRRDVGTLAAAVGIAAMLPRSRMPQDVKESDVTITHAGRRMRRLFRHAGDGRARGRARVARHLRVAPGDARDGQALGRGRLQRARRESVLSPDEGAVGAAGRADADSAVGADDASADGDDAHDGREGVHRVARRARRGRQGQEDRHDRLLHGRPDRHAHGRGRAESRRRRRLVPRRRPDHDELRTARIC